MKKSWKPALAILVLLIAVQEGGSLLARTHRMHAFLVGRLEKAFGRQIEVGSFDVRLLPSPGLDASPITVGEDPGFGHEYFLRAEKLTAGLRWFGLLRGHFEIGTISLSKPSLILARNAQGRWNLENWLPPAKSGSAQSPRLYGPSAPAAPVNRLEKIEFDDGRINFKTGDQKLAFAFITVSGSVEQFSSGRWHLQLEAQPWRSGVLLQSAGTIRVMGDVAGTSARLQPAEISLHWSEASLADVFRLFRGQDQGVRGLFSLDGTAKSATEKGDAPGDWKFSVQTRATQIHHWSLTERADNPRLNLSVAGRWNVGKSTFDAEQFTAEGPRSNIRGRFLLTGGLAPALELRMDSIGVQASDLLAWYRAFQPDVAEGLTADEYFTGGMILRGWPLTVESAALSSNGGTIRIPGFPEPVRVGPFSGGRERSVFSVGPVRVALGAALREVQAPKRRRVASAMENAVDLTFAHDLNSRVGSLAVEGHLLNIEDFSKLTAAFGRQVNHGWEMTGGTTGVMRLDWAPNTGARWNGRIGFDKANLTVVGLNQPLKINEGALDWIEGKRAARLLRVDGFGGTWSGSIKEISQAEPSAPAKWNFNLAVDQLNAADLDRWVGPRARPNWLQRLLPQLLGGSAPAVPASELVRRINAEGELLVEHLTIEKLKLDHVAAIGSLRELHLEVSDATGEWAGGKVRAKIVANFLPRPVYEISANLDRVSLAKLPGAGRAAEFLAGSASGILQLKTEGVGREGLLAKLTGQGDVRLSKVEFRGFDVNASVSDGEVHAGMSRWTSGEGTLRLKDSRISLDDFHLEGPKLSTLVTGTLSFGRNADLSITNVTPPKNKSAALSDFVSGHILRISGPLDGPRISVEKSAVRTPAD